MASETVRVYGLSQGALKAGVGCFKPIAVKIKTNRGEAWRGFVEVTFETEINFLTKLTHPSKHFCKWDNTSDRGWIVSKFPRGIWQQKQKQYNVSPIANISKIVMATVGQSCFIMVSCQVLFYRGFSMTYVFLKRFWKSSSTDNLQGAINALLPYKDLSI